MRSRADGARRGGAAALLAGLLAGAVAAPASVPSAASASLAASAASAPATPREAAVDKTIAALRAEQRAAGTRKTHVLRLRPSRPASAPEPSADAARFARWIEALGRLLSEGSRVLVWGLAALAIVLLALRLPRLATLRRHGGSARGPVVSHVRDLDVRPGSLPPDVGAAAWSLWQAGDVAGALSLLYRGTLSRFIHRHGVPIEAASTEGECLALARGRVDTPVLAYATRVVRAWEAARYGARLPATEVGETLCRDFAPAFDALPLVPPAPTAEASA